MKLNSKEIIINKIPTSIEGVDESELGPLLGSAHVYKSQGGLKGKIKIRKGLPKRVKKFIEEHEIYHIKNWGREENWLAGELKANFFASIKEPLGLLQTTIITLLDSERRSYYIKKLFKPQNNS